MQITSIDHLSDGKLLINKCIKIWFYKGKLNAEFDSTKIKEYDAANLIDTYLSTIIEKLDQLSSP